MISYCRMCRRCSSCRPYVPAASSVITSILLSVLGYGLGAVYINGKATVPDCVALVRGKRLYTVEYSPANLIA